MRIYSLKRKNIPKIAVIATGMAAAVVAATMSIAPAQALPSYASNCTGCHSAGGSVSATPSNAKPAPGAAYTVAIVITTTNSGNSGYWISGNGASVVGSPSSATTKSANMTAPAAVGTYTYTVWADKGSPPGQASSTTYSITVAPVVTVPPTTVPPTTVPPTTVPPTTVPPTTVPPTTVPPTTVPPTTVPPTTVPPTTVPPTTVPPTTPPASIARIRSLSPDEASIGSTVTIKGTGFGRAGVVKFGSAIAKVSSWTSTKIVVKVPSISRQEVDVTVTPLGGAASNGVEFDVKGHHGDDGDNGDSGHFVRIAGAFQS